MKIVRKFLAMLVLISFSFCSLGSEIAFARDGRSAPPPRQGARPPAPQPRPPQPRPPQPRPPQPRPPRPVLPHPRPPRPMPPPPPFYRHRPDYRYDWGYRDWGYRDHGYRYNSSRYEKVGFMLGALVLLGGILSSISSSEQTHKTPESSPPPTPPKTSGSSDIEKLRAELNAKPDSLQTLEDDLRTELGKSPVDKEKAMKIYMELRRKEQELADEKFYDYLDSVK